MDGFNDRCETLCIHEDDVKLVRSKMIEENMAVMLSEVFKVLADSTRIKILDLLYIKELCVCDIAEALGMNQSAISHQLRLLRNMRLVKYRRDGKTIYYSLDDNHILNLFNEGLEHVKHSYSIE